jgi:signal peptidase I
MGDFFSYMGRIGLTFPFLLLGFTVFTLVVIVVDSIWQKKIEAKGANKRVVLPKLVDYSRSFFLIFLIVLILRSFVAQPYTVPTGSLEPTVIPGDLILVEQFAYGLKMPVWDNVLIKTGDLHRGDIALFHYPVNPRLNFVKRVIGLPGDVISYVNGQFIINGKKAPIHKEKTGTDLPQPGFPTCPTEVYTETLPRVDGTTVTHEFQRVSLNSSVNCRYHRKVASVNFYNLKVPQGEYMMIGDNRDDSDDSRFWGFVPRHDFIGRAFLVWFNWNSEGSWFTSKFPFFLRDKVRWYRIGTKI